MLFFYCRLKNMQRTKLDYKKNYWEIRFSSKKNFPQSSKWKIKKIKNIVIVFFLLIFLIFCFWFIKNVVLSLPDISEINGMIFSESTIIQDRNGKELYKLYEENREYVPYSWISKNMINALVAMEDQRYREHGGLDPIGIFRAWINNVLHPWAGMQWASTIPQQLLKNLLLNKNFKRETKQEKIIRKMQEILLTKKLNSVIEKEINKENPSIEKSELHNELKKKVLELYLNYIALWNNAFGVEAASKTYFSKSAKDLDVLESSILASIPKSPTVYNPYKNKERVLWFLSIIDQDWVQLQLTWSVFDQILSKLTRWLESIEIDKSWWYIKSIEANSSFVITEWDKTYVVKYVVWRKDFALMRMYEDWYITQNELKQSFFQWLTYELRANRVEMLAPHFVQRVIEELEKTYDKDTLFKWWIIIKTTLDLDQQIIAEQSLVWNSAVLQEHWANNSSMVYLDSTNGDVLAYVGSINYFDEKIQWQNDMVRRPRQSWSAIKPFIYALWFQLLPLTLDTPMFDIPFKIWQDQPNNADGKFSWLIPLKLALAHSRNIPATKMILALWWESVAKPYLRDLWLVGVRDSIEYGYTLALWAAEIAMLNLTNAFSHLSTTQPAEINPILEIRSRDGSLIYKKENVKQKEVIPGWIRYLLWNILSKSENRLAGWISKFNVQGLTLAIKTWTSNVKTDRWNRPRDGWMAVYNSTKVAVFRAGNADWTPMNRNAFGGTIHANPMRNFFTALVRNNFISNDIVKSVDVTTVDVSKISWKLANENTPSEFIVNTMKYIHSPALESESNINSFEYDILCNWAQSPTTPLDSLYKWYEINPSTIIPNKIDLAEITERRKVWSSFTWVAPQWWFISWEVTYNYPNVFVNAPIEWCEGRWSKEDLSITIDVITPEENKTVSNKFSLWHSVKAERGVKSVLVFANGKQISHFPYNWKEKVVNELNSISSALSEWQYDIEILAVDIKWYSNRVSFKINIVTKDAVSPTILESKTKVQLLDNGKYQISIIVEDDLSFVEYWKILVWEKIISEFKWNVVTFTLDKLVPVSVFAKDAYANIIEKTIELEQYLL